nr:dethiobiotin synthase [Nitrosomonas sp. Nm51]
MTAGFFVTGTDTGIGKTLVSSLMLHALSALGNKTVGMKPIAAGKENGKWPDVELLRTAGNVQVPHELINPYALDQAIAPHIAARQQGVEIDLPAILNAFHALKKAADYVVVEGAGGFLVPINTYQDTSDMAQSLGLPVILVVGMRLGCINHALLTVHAVQHAGLPLLGWVANCIDPKMQALEENIIALQHRIDRPLLGTVPFDSKPDLPALSRFIDLSGIV